MSLREIANVERPFVRAARRLGYLALKFVTPGVKGSPDRIVLKGIERATKMYMLAAGPMSHKRAEHDMRELLAMCIEFVELKAPGKEAEAHQWRYHANLRQLGFKVTVIDSPAGVEEWTHEA